MVTGGADRDSGRGVITPDGCAVEVYLRLPPNGEPEIVNGVIPAGATILELGCGTGRLSNPLAEFGHRVVGVDESPAMLAHLRQVEPVPARIEDLRLDRRFDVVLLASHLVNTPTDEQLRRFLVTCRHHLAPGGQLIAQWHPPRWFDALQVGAFREGDLGPVFGRLDVLDIAGDLLSGETSYRSGDDVWVQRFTARRLTEQRLTEELRRAGLGAPRWLDDAHHWFSARLADDPDR
ncbi:class I SAM-dependent methyltransferase [Micromonospora sp. NPDC050397]|uniref:class I SAM-dependent methyltransferase n=1 Tax=Micromonospora sp. NPDC050397 TaxID=3364279 RepID=UPI00384BA273